jgi:hypothetical protein
MLVAFKTFVILSNSCPGRHGQIKEIDMSKLYKIKPLVFENEHGNLYEATTKFCRYTIWPREIDKGWMWRHASSSGHGSKRCASLKTAMAQAQAHYEQALSEELEEVDVAGEIAAILNMKIYQDQLELPPRLEEELLSYLTKNVKIAE